MTVEQLKTLEQQAVAIREQVQRSPRQDKEAAGAVLRHARGLECAAAVWRQRLERTPRS